MTTRLQRSFLSLSSTSSSFFPSPSSSYSPPLVLRLNSLMSKCGPLQNVSGFSLIPSPRSGTRLRCKNFTHLRLKASRLSSLARSQGFTDACKSVYPPSVIIPSTTSFYSDLNGRIGLGAHCYGAVSVRHFSQAPETNSSRDLLGKCSKVSKTRAAKQKNVPADSSVLTANGVDALNSSNGINGNVTLGTGATQTANVNGKEKPSKSTKSKRRPSAAASLEKEAVGNSGRSKSENVCKLTLPAFQKKSTEKASEHLADVSASTKPKAKKGTGNSRRKSKAANESTEKQKPQDMSNLKPPRQGDLKPLYPPTGKTVMVVESVTKAKVIQGYLGSMYEVLPSYGHVRDLAARSGSVRPDEDFSMVWEVPSAAWTYLKSIKVALSG
ncbi:DNA topoisomerase 1 [Linum grandiflorum]